MNISKLFLIFLIGTASCFGSEPTSGNQSSFWSNLNSNLGYYLKYLNPFYYLTKYQLKKAKDELKIAEQKVIKILDDQLTLFQADIDILKKITNEDELDQYQGDLKTSLTLHQLQELKPEEFLKEKENIIKELNEHIEWAKAQKLLFQAEVLFDTASNKIKELEKRIEE